MNVWQRMRRRLSVKPDLRDGAGGWVAAGRGTADRPPEVGQQQYRDALEAWRQNPYAKRIIDIITDYTVGDGLVPLAPGEIGRFTDAFWHHPQNRLDLRLPELVDELSRAGDLFLVLFRNPIDGMSYVRAVPKSEIIEIVTAENDWEREIAYAVTSDEFRDSKYEIRDTKTDQTPPELVSRISNLVSNGRVFLSPNHPDAAAAEAVMVHYSINRPVGARLGESELASILPWLRFYSRMLEDRVRLNWAARAFLWFVSVPSCAGWMPSTIYGRCARPSPRAAASRPIGTATAATLTGR